MKFRYSIIGAGKVGSAFAASFKKLGFCPECVIDSDIKKAKRLCKFLESGNAECRIKDEQFLKSNLILLCVNDNAVEEISLLLKNFRNKAKRNVLLMHTSGNLPASVLYASGFPKINIGSFHPVQAFNKIGYEAEKLINIYFGISGGREAVKFMRMICRKLRSDFLFIPDKNKSLYHLLCVIASNFIYSDYLVISDILKRTGIDRQKMNKALTELSIASLRNIKISGVHASVTGPVVRQDVSTVSDHLNALKRIFPEYLVYYKSNSGIINKFIKNSKPELRRILK